jgi:hypothetical protein
VFISVQQQFTKQMYLYCVKHENAVSYWSISTLAAILDIGSDPYWCPRSHCTSPTGKFIWTKRSVKGKAVRDFYPISYLGLWPGLSLKNCIYFHLTNIWVLVLFGYSDSLYPRSLTPLTLRVYRASFRKDLDSQNVLHVLTNLCLVGKQ